MKNTKIDNSKSTKTTDTKKQEEITKNEKLAEEEYKKAKDQAKIAQQAYESVKKSKDFHVINSALKTAIDAATLATTATQASQTAAIMAGTSNAKKSSQKAVDELTKANTAVEDLKTRLSELEESGHS